jgi:polyferredoxin
MTVQTLRKRPHKKRPWIRTASQIFFFALIALISVNHTLVESGKSIPFLSSASIHALCPFGGVVTIYQYITAGSFVQKIHESAFILMILGFLLALILGPVFCGWVCPLGSLQEWISKLGRKIFKRRFNHFIPEKVDRYLRYLRYLVAAWIIFMTAKSATLVFAQLDPYNALFTFWSSEVAIGGLIVLGVTIILSLFVERPWCKYACPYGALLGIFNRFRVAKLHRNEKTCINCKKCDQICPMNIKVSEVKTVNNQQCISCLKCTSEEVCPVANTVYFQIGGSNEA